jgi:hypothetical protein
MGDKGFWTRWNNMDIPSQFLPHLTPYQSKHIMGWIWLAPPGAGKTHIANRWLKDWASWAELDYGKSVWIVNVASIQNWESFLKYVEQWVVQKRQRATQGNYDSWIWFDVCERFMASQQWDLIERLRDKGAERVGILWTTSSIFSWIPEVISGCRIWNWMEFIQTEEAKNAWIEKYGKHTKIWDYVSIRYLRPHQDLLKKEKEEKEEETVIYESMNQICKRAWYCIYHQDWKGWVEIGKNTSIFRIPWNDLMDTIKTIVMEAGGFPPIPSVQERFRTWCVKGIQLTPMIPRIDSFWHCWNQWGYEGIRILYGGKMKKSYFPLPHMECMEEQVNPRIWLEHCWNREIPKMQNLIIWGPPGGGKTSFVESWIHKWFGNPIDKHWVYYRNSSLEKWTKLFRNELEPFLSVEPLHWGACPTDGIRWRWVVLDEVDQMNVEAQEFLRSQMVRVQNENIPVYFLLIANERSKLNWALSSRFQVIHWMTPTPEWVRHIFPIQESVYKRTPETKDSLYHWWKGYTETQIKEIPVPKRWWDEESGDLRRYKMRCEMGILDEVCVKEAQWYSRGDIQHIFWEKYCEEEHSKEWNLNVSLERLNHLPLWVSIKQKDAVLSYVMGDEKAEIQEISKIKQPDTILALDIYTAWMRRSYKKNKVPPNTTWFHPMGAPIMKWMGSIWKELNHIYKDWKIKFQVFDIYDTPADANWVFGYLKTQTRIKVESGQKTAIFFIILNAHLLQEEAQVSLRRLIDDSQSKIIWWFCVSHILQWMEPLRSRAEPLLVSLPSKTEEEEISGGLDSSMGIRVRVSKQIQF